MYKARKVEKAIEEVRDGLNSIDPEIARLLPVEFEQSKKICEIAAGVVKGKQIPEISVRIATENGSGFTPARQTAAKSCWMRRP